VYVENGVAYIRSDAPLRIAARLPLPGRLLVPALLLPRFVRDTAYDTVATNRYDWFGRAQGEGVCGGLTPAQRARFYLD